MGHKVSEIEALAKRLGLHFETIARGDGVRKFEIYRGREKLILVSGADRAFCYLRGYEDAAKRWG
jgi:hypothetical protein